MEKEKKEHHKKEIGKRDNRITLSRREAQVIERLNSFKTAACNN